MAHAAVERARYLTLPPPQIAVEGTGRRRLLEEPRLKAAGSRRRRARTAWIPRGTKLLLRSCQYGGSHIQKQSAPPPASCDVAAVGSAFAAWAVPAGP
nr:unnamed protein product [Digitaria exilis]